MFLAVILRYVFHIHLSWTDETTTHMMTWGVFLGVASVSRANSHIRIGFFAEKMLGARRAAIVWTTTENVIGTASPDLLHKTFKIKYTHQNHANKINRP
ncbi:TRAP transporter small permease [Chloroflexota bacterium]